VGLSSEQRLSLIKNARQQLMYSIEIKKQLISDDYLDNLVSMAENIVRSLANGGKLLLCGNGGSAADAQHLAAELLVRLRSHVNRQGIPAISLALDTSTITACANDYSFEYLYERMVQTLGKTGDILLGITTSGRSINIIKALKAAHQKGMLTFGFLGGDGGGALKECNLALVIPSKQTDRIQEAHITAGHILMELIEDLMIEKNHVKLMDDMFVETSAYCSIE
jgi:D-sedoheptulose 7-phosphate isomerase